MSKGCERFNIASSKYPLFIVGLAHVLAEACGVVLVHVAAIGFEAAAIEHRDGAIALRVALRGDVVSAKSVDGSCDLGSAHNGDQDR